MFEINDLDPLVRARKYNSVTGSTITVGSIAALADAADDNRATMAKLAAKLDGALADLERRIASVEAETRAAIAGAGGETLAQRLARLNPR